MPINRNTDDRAKFNGMATLPYELRLWNFESAILSDMLTASLAKHSRVLTENTYYNGHPDLVVQGPHPDNAVKTGSHGIEIKTTRKRRGAVDAHGARDQWMCVFVYGVDYHTEPATDRQPMAITEVYLSHVTVEGCSRNPRGELGTRPATLDRHGIQIPGENWLYRV